MTDYPALVRELTRRIDANPKRRLLIIQEFYAEVLASGDTAAADHLMYIRELMKDPNSPTPSPPKWLQPVGVCFGALTFLFFMIIVVLSIVGYPVPQGGKFALVAVLALGSAFSAAAWIGSMVISGEIPSLENQKPLVVSAAGGFAVFVIVFMLGYWLYIK